MKDHVHKWKFNTIAITGAAGIECPHGWDACPRCDNYCEICEKSQTEIYEPNVYLGVD